MQPYVFNHLNGQLTIYAKGKNEAWRKAKKVAQGMHIVPAFTVKKPAKAKPIYDYLRRYTPAHT